ncbi:MAG: hypothetical protein IIT56_03685, partial [Bacteroidales bacterium]|nr:hypothetical protein [Bacteroidales bacterium]
MELIAVTLKADTSSDRFEDAKTLLNYGFSTYALADAGEGVTLKAIPVELGTADTVPGVYRGDSLEFLYVQEK